jgi:hypothetical protein
MTSVARSTDGDSVRELFEGFLLPEAANAGRYPAESYVCVRRNVAGEYPI